MDTLHAEPAAIPWRWRWVPPCTPTPPCRTRCRLWSPQGCRSTPRSTRTTRRRRGRQACPGPFFSGQGLFVTAVRHCGLCAGSASDHSSCAPHGHYSQAKRWGVEGEAANHFCEGERENHCPLFLSTRWQAQPDCCMGRHCIEREYTTKSICYNRRAYWGCCVALTGEGVRGALARFWVGVSFSKKVKNGPGNVQTGRYRPPSQFFGRRVEDKKS